MTIVIDATRAAELATAGQSNNPAALWNNIATASNITSENGDVSGYPATNAVTGTTYDDAQPVVTSTEAALIVSGTALTANAACIYAHNIGTIGASVRVQYSDDGGTTWTDGGAGPVTPADDQAIFWRFDERSEDDWRLLIFNVSGSDQPIIGGFCIGVELLIEQRIYQGYTPPITPTAVSMVDNTSEGQHILGTRFVERGSEIAVDLTHMTPATLRGVDWVAFQNHFNQGGALLWAWRPTKYGDAFWCRRSGSAMVPTNSGPKDYMSVSFALRAYHE